VLCLQAECQTTSDPVGRAVGDMLWPEWFDKRHWDQFRMNRRTWSSLYQQRPAPAEGILFRRDDMATYERLPDDLRIICASDNAATPDGGDWTEQGTAGIAPDGSLHLLDWWRGQVGPEIWIERQIDMMVRHKPLVWFCEAGPLRRATEGRLRARMAERNVKCRLEYLPTIADKPTMAQSIIATAGMGKLWWPRAAWVPELQRQCLVFPAGSPDDGVDTLGLLGRGADSLGKAWTPPPPVEVIPIVSHWGRR
jgi:phage terminase large subunit-like protein